MQRYFIDSNNWNDDEVKITNEDFHHVVHVMRMQEGDTFIANHPDQDAAKCKITFIDENQVVAVVEEWLEETKELPVHITIAQGLPKGDKWEFVLQKGTELGAVRFVPIQAARSVVKWDAKKQQKKVARWQKIVKEASEQAHRNKLPDIDPVLSVKDFVKQSASYDWKFFAYEETARQYPTVKLHHYFSQIEVGQSVMVCIGPEGGFDEDEAIRLKQNGFQAIRLGPRILRTETAPLYVLANLSYYFEEMR
ncbi:16S rRNA (uracil(1498)-N(3))-methyltransferase [Gracilibacillus caseinilyticus]|uniref:Ribosomal RNA small subunit methyltransferase E n=1 Tax=Gracilibacillus caseinilyticus TaxID=2932256 RepID=A0ABY4ETV2_9BACI|nr:16S rRNA (uracil(1498)-N(3))-methyltransferase [Gracilibacillus caseinilyticus]UOQ47405.1 16S rRNA (uracil(1498)-N(3))-methyltransferase [Gracilibacillus caseinilyticus]